ncbi:hypothetical protein GOODEAATRI_023430, partial [Goodea atripinnis]
IDVNIFDQKGLTALDTVKDMPSQKSREIAALILGHKTGKPPDIDLPPPPIPPPQESPSPRKKGEIYRDVLRKHGASVLYTGSSADERREPAEEQEDHTYELLLTAETKVPPPSLESQSNKGNCELLVNPEGGRLGD